tara:strand:+ start:283 stop:414 length:132 start_codon:yes stop_codon:yes gene_type:complete
MFTYFNDEWNPEKDKDDDIDVPRMARSVKDAATGEKQEEVQSK